MSSHQEPSHRSAQEHSISSPETGGLSMAPPAFQLKAEGDPGDPDNGGVTQLRVASETDPHAQGVQDTPAVERTEVNDGDGLIEMEINDLMRLFQTPAGGDPMHVQLGTTLYEYTDEWRWGDDGVAIMRGALRHRFATLACFPTGLDQVRSWLEGHAEGERGTEMSGMVDEAEQRAGDMGGEMAALSAPALVEEGNRGRTFSPRGTNRRTGDDMSGRIHAAQDVFGPHRTAVYAPRGGRVIQVRRQNGYGWVVRIEHHPQPGTRDEQRGDLVSNFAHLNEPLVEEDQEVYPGQAIGLMGAEITDGSGRSTRVDPIRTHLHWSVQQVPEGGPGGFGSRYEERRDIRINNDEWLDEIGTDVSHRRLSREELAERSRMSPREGRR